MKLYTGLLVAGIILVGGGLWLLFNQSVASDSDSPIGSQWWAVSINGSEVIGNTYVNLYLHNDGSVRGSSGCNMYGGSYSLNPPNIKIFDGDDGFVTSMGCAEDILEQEDIFLDCLHNAASYSVIGSYMELHDASGKTLILFERRPEYPMDPDELIGTSWQLARINGVPVTELQAVTLIFDDTGNSGRGEGRGYSAFFGYEFSYQANGDDIIVTGTRSWRTAEIPRELREDAGIRFRMVPAVFTYRLAADLLELSYTPDLTFTFEPLEDSDGGQ